MLLSVILLQSVAGPPRPAPAPAASDTHSECAAGSAPEGDIVVCAHRRGEGYRITAPVTVETEPRLPKADFRLFGQARGRIGGQQNSVGGFTSNRAMATIAIPF